jgi:hypothetical protein
VQDISGQTHLADIGLIICGNKKGVRFASHSFKWFPAPGELLPVPSAGVGASRPKIGSPMDDTSLDRES